MTRTVRRATGGAGRVTSCASVLLLLATIGCAGSSTPVGRERIEGPRRVHEVDLNAIAPRWQVGGGTEGDALLRPARMLLTDQLVVVLDAAPPQILGIERATGAVRWTLDRRGQGPEEWSRPVALAWHPEGVVVGDPGNGRLTLLAEDGSVRRQLPVPGGLPFSEMCGLADGSLLLALPDMRGLRLLAISGVDGSLTTIGDPFPYDETPGPEMYAEVTTAHGAEAPSCVAARVIADGLATFGLATRGAYSRYVERLTQRPAIPAMSIRDTSDLPLQFASGVTVVGGRAFVQTGDAMTGCGRRCLDVYALPDIVYERTWRVHPPDGVRIIRLVVGAGELYLLGLADDLPVLIAYSADFLVGE